MTSFIRAHWPLSTVLIFTPLAVAAQDMEAPPATMSSPANDLSTHLRTLARTPRDLNALIGAGQSALSVGDATAALSFFGRANEVSPNDGRVKAGLGSTLLLMERPDDALRLFGEAVALGVPQNTIAVDRGLAYDLRGDQTNAQRDYRLALQSSQSDELVRRYALSLGISGQRNEALTRLDPLLRKQDQAAWRDRTFILAMNGDVRGANSIIHSIMPQQAEAMAPFLRRLANFTPAQRALAVTYGTMPEDTRVAVAVPPSVIAPAQSALAKPFGVLITPTPQPRFETPAPTAKPKPVPAPVLASPVVVIRPAPVAPPLPMPKPAPLPAPAPELETTVASSTVEAEATNSKSPLAHIPAPMPTTPSASPVVSTPVVPKTIIVPPPQPIEHAAVAVVTSPVAAPTAVLSPTSVSSPALTPEAKPISAPPPIAVIAQPRFTMANLLDDVKPEAQTQAAHVPTDKELRVARIAAKKKADEKARVEAEEKAKADAKKAEAEAQRQLARRNPARVWVQVATGNNRAGFGHTWTKLKAAHAAAFGNKSAYVTPVNRTYRVLVGPFDDTGDARALVRQLGQEGLSANTFSSDAGQEVLKISSKGRAVPTVDVDEDKPKHKSRKARDKADATPPDAQDKPSKRKHKKR